MKILRSKFLQAVLILVGVFLFFRFGIRPPAPWSVIRLYMTIATFAVLVYVSSNSDAWESFLQPIRSTLTDDSRRPIRVALIIIVPLLLGYYTYSSMAAEQGAPPELRAIHPAPPVSMTFRGKTIDVQGIENPLRKDTANFRKHVAEGAVVYIKNCVYCHGDLLDGDGHFAPAFNPRPANFTDPGTIAMLQEGYLFWRIAKGGPGLPKESAPWNSVMPAWEDRLREEDIWKVILYLYDETGYKPRRWEAALSPEPSRAVEVGDRWYNRFWSIAEAQQAGDATAGKAIYEKKCALCHGTGGKGDGPGAATLDPKPRDFTRGLYKIRSTASGQRPTDTDLFRVVTEGMIGTSMPAWKALSEKDRWNLVAYIKSFAAEKFTEPPKPADLPKEVSSSKESLARGKEMFEAIECTKCHGNAGRADGPSAPDLKDDWGNPIRPANLTKPWLFRGGESAREIATRLVTGLMGTPMPSFIDSVEKPEDIWHLANYVKTLGPDRPNFATILSVHAVQGEIPDDPSAPFWAQQVSANFPLAGQVTVDPRNFTPSIDMITVRAVYSDKEIAFHLSWDDPTASKTDAAAKTFADQVALQFAAKSSPEGERPYLFMGDSGNPVYLLRWNSESGVEEATANGLGSINAVKKEETRAKGRAEFADGRYRLVVKRPRVVPAEAAMPSFSTQSYLPVAFFAWDGSSGESGNKFSMSSWYYLRLEPPPSKGRWVYPPLVVAAFLGLEIWGVRRLRRRVRR